MSYNKGGSYKEGISRCKPVYGDESLYYILELGTIRVRKHHFGGILYTIDGRKEIFYVEK